MNLVTTTDAAAAKPASSTAAWSSAARAGLAVVLSGSAAMVGLWGGSAMAQTAPPSPIAAALSAAASAEATALPPAGDRALAEFQAVRVDGSLKVRLRTGAAQRVSVLGDAERAKDIHTRVETLQGVPTLVIGSGSRWFQWGRRTDAVEIVVQVPSVQSVELAGSGDVELELVTRQPRLRLAVAGSGDLTARGADVEALEANVAGSGDLRVQGRAGTVAVAVAGSGDAWLQDLVAQDADVNVAGSGDARVHATRRLSAAVAGSGDVRYKGEPTMVRSVVRGAGTIKKF